MEEYIKKFCEQNPMIEIECKNPQCKYKDKIPSKRFLSNSRSYVYKCKKCGSETKYNVSDFYKKLKPLKPFC